MKRKFVQIAALCLAAALLTAAGGEKASAASADSNSRLIRVGLHYGTGAMEGLNLQTTDGAGFRFGYYNSENRLVELGATDRKSISVVETMNVYYGTYSGYVSYHTALTSSAVAVGEYHLQVSGPYASFAEAQSAAAGYEGGFPAYIGGAFYARVGNYTTRDRAVAAQEALSAQGVEAQLCGTSEYGVSVVVTGTNAILFQFDDLGRGTGLGVEPLQTGSGKCSTWSKGSLYDGGFRFERIGGGKMTVVNIVGLEDYVKGVVPNEMSDSWPIEALKAGAVTARSYALTLGSVHSSYHFDLCYSDHCQAYYGREKAGANSDGAVDQTAGQVVYSGGKVAQTFYYSSNGGASESVSNVWGSNQSVFPYLVGKEDPYESALNLKNTWERTFTSAQIISRLLAGKNVRAPIVSAEITAYTEMGNPKLITFTDSAGSKFSVSGRLVYRDLGLASFRFGFAGEDETSQPATSGGVMINGDAAGYGVTGLYVVDGEGNITALGDSVYILTDSGTVPLEQGGGETPAAGNGWAGSATAVNGSITFAGRGWGHNVGMSQWGAYAMAKEGKTYLDILQFYYTDITVGYM